MGGTDSSWRLWISSSFTEEEENRSQRGVWMSIQSPSVLWEAGAPALRRRDSFRGSFRPRFSPLRGRQCPRISPRRCDTTPRTDSASWLWLTNPSARSPPSRRPCSSRGRCQQLFFFPLFRSCLLPASHGMLCSPRSLPHPSSLQGIKPQPVLKAIAGCLPDGFLSCLSPSMLSARWGRRC